MQTCLASKPKIPLSEATVSSSKGRCIVEGFRQLLKLICMSGEKTQEDIDEYKSA